ncbi:F-box only protein 28 [Lutzomyia longipalpis]|uniref:F-box domain-containing protein n=1 Tax=Lutzomyia longipalpis TaxID=7200 RepID=A0A1B0CVY5_LUTLO|nr:F-box only protein 28 [Lutzomyia longipalpis]
MNILHLPDCMIAQIFEHLAYDEVAKKRLVCKRIDAICQRILNRGFMKMIRLHGINMKKIKSKLPRRESERRNHPLSRHADILTCIETRISMLTMTYGKYIEAKLCCFIPGKVVDEVLRLLRLVQETTLQVRSHEILQELRDISSMAIEHFDEKISLALKKAFIETTKQRLPPTTSFTQILTDSVLVTDFNTARPSGDTPTATCTGRNRQDCSTSRRNRLSIVKIDKAMAKTTAKVNRLVQLQNKQVRQLRVYGNTVAEMKTQIADLRRRLDESEAKNREISANISQIKDTTGQIPQGAPIRTSHIKPRMATIILKRRISGSASHEPEDTGESSKKPRSE